MVRYRQSFKLRDALIELEDHGYISLLVSDETLESIDDDTDLTQGRNIVQIVVRKSLKLIIVSETPPSYSIFTWSEEEILREFINKRLSKLGISTKYDGVNFKEYLADIGTSPWILNFLSFSHSFNASPYVKELEEKSTKRMIEIILKNEEWIFANLPLSAHTK